MSVENLTNSVSPASPFSPEDFRHNFLARLRKNELVEKLMELLPSNIMLYVKDTESRMIMGNQAFVRQIGLQNERDIIGKNDYDFFWPLQADAYRRDDAEVVRTGTPQIGKCEIMPTADGVVDWYHTSKMPLHDADGNIVGIVGVTQDTRTSSGAQQAFRALEPAIRHIMDNYAKPIHAEELAAISGLSLPRFTRRFKREFQVTPGRYLTMVRLNVACRLLASTQKSIATIALESGFYDHSFFTKQFVKYKGMTPKEFRSRFRDMPDQKRFFPLGIPEGPMPED
jgi:PAS domain S-box-containing protein